MKEYYRKLLETIHQAHDRLVVIPASEWNDDLFYDRSDGSSNLFGHYVRTLDKFKSDHPADINFKTYMREAAPLCHALNEFLDLIMPPRMEWDAYAIASGRSADFSDTCPRARAMKLFDKIMEKYPKTQAVIH